MTDLTLDKIKNMLGAHNDGVYRLESRDNLGEIVEWLVDELEAARAEIESAPSLEECERNISDAIDKERFATCWWMTAFTLLVGLACLMLRANL